MRTYLDWNATTPPRPEVLDAMRDAALRAWANPSSIHADGRRARSFVEDARAAVGALVGADPRDIVFTSGGTEANNLALRSAFPLLGAGAAARVLVTSRLEHPSVTRVAEALEREGRARVRWLDVRAGGVVDLDDLDRALAEGDVALVTVQALNHETGVIQPVGDVIARTHAVGAKVHVDAIQAWGKIDVAKGWDTAAIAAHKMRGPKGIGALVATEGRLIEPLLVGGAQEKGIRPGTVDAALAAGFGVAASFATLGVARYAELAPLRDEIEVGLLSLKTQQGAPAIAGDASRRAPHVSNLVWPGWIGAELVAALDLEGVSVSSGAACSAGTVEPSPVLLAMVGSDDAARGVRISIGEDTTRDDAERAIRAYRAVLAR